MDDERSVVCRFGYVRFFCSTIYVQSGDPLSPERSMMRVPMRRVLLSLGVLLVFFGGGTAHGEAGWSLGFYGGRAVYDTLREVLSDREYADSYAAALLVGRELTGYRHYLRLEAEGQVVKHFDLMNHFEVNALVVLRWLPFPWDRYLDTSFAVGEGLSYATRDPAIEVEKHGRTSQLLNYLLFELAFCLPQHPRWDYFLRVHHRSGVFGLFDGVSGGSNLVGAGFRYRF
jgi:hypothetical protein